LTNVHKIYILQSIIINHEGGGTDTSSFSGRKPGARRKLLRNIANAKNKYSTPNPRSFRGVWENFIIRDVFKMEVVI
jgi:hypothetical protein